MRLWSNSKFTLVDTTLIMACQRDLLVLIACCQPFVRLQCLLGLNRGPVLW